MISCLWLDTLCDVHVALEVQKNSNGSAPESSADGGGRQQVRSSTPRSDLVSCRYPAMTTDHSNCKVQCTRPIAPPPRTVLVSGQELCTGAPALIGMPQQMMIVWSSHQLHGKRASAWPVGVSGMTCVQWHASVAPLGDAVSVIDRAVP